MKLPTKSYAMPAKKRDKELKEAIKLKKNTMLSLRRLLSVIKRIATWPRLRAT